MQLLKKISKRHIGRVIFKVIYSDGKGRVVSKLRFCEYTLSNKFEPRGQPISSLIWLALSFSCPRSLFLRPGSLQVWGSFFDL